MHIPNLFPVVPFLHAPDEGAGDNTDDGAGADGQSAEKTEEQPAKESEPKAEEKKFSQAELDRIVKERLERERKKSEEQTVKAKADAEKKALEEQGEFKKLAEQNQQTAEEEKKRREAIEAELISIRLRGAFEKASSHLGLRFANDAAADDAFAKLDVEAVGEDLKGMDEAIKKLMKDRPYLFEKQDAEDIDARRTGKMTQSAVNEATIQSKRRSGTYKGI